MGVGRSEMGVGKSEMGVGRSEMAVGKSEMGVGRRREGRIESEIHVRSEEVGGRKGRGRERREEKYR